MNQNADETSTLPEVVGNMIYIETKCVGLSPERVKEAVTIPLETSLESFHEIEKIISTSEFELSTLELHFNQGVSDERRHEIPYLGIERVKITHDFDFNPDIFTEKIITTYHVD